ncbi:hypothetical protein HELRODRAFT_161080 [Helobdella robusta]|uniref:Uncharacterized protein n=1 Tax=Helobdella robusta TaxID=6412 RepID=T1ER29_HELRO|nr:hypothetical protein HELRODRAFT_161080 [Helobdella robusta]ESO01890.1 hypothetical protein HELRODRAFT_161080 [Helobdella robusta]
MQLIYGDVFEVLLLENVAEQSVDTLEALRKWLLKSVAGSSIDIEVGCCGVVSQHSSMNFANRWVLRSALNFVSNGEIVREVNREFQRKRPEKAKANLAKDCLTRVKKKREQFPLITNQ